MTALLEDDLRVPVDGCSATCEGLTELFAQHSYDSSVIFGHASDGNIHFLVNERFSERTSLALGTRRPHRRHWSDLVLARRTGTSRPSTASGRMMAPYVERQYGRDLYEVMREIKRLIDPRRPAQPRRGAPGRGSVDRHRRPQPKLPVTVESGVDRCIECGFCEPGCPSKGHHAHAAPADHGAPRHGCPARRREHGRRGRAGSRLGVRGHRHVRRRRDQAGVPGLDQHRRPDPALRREKANPVLAATWGLAARAWGAGTRGGGSPSGWLTRCPRGSSPA